MPRYKLRTLLIALALGPPLLAGLWLLRDVRLAFAIGWAFMCGSFWRTACRITERCTNQ